MVGIQAEAFRDFDMNCKALQGAERNVFVASQRGGNLRGSNKTEPVRPRVGGEEDSSPTRVWPLSALSPEFK